MGDIDIHNMEQRYNNIIKAIKESTIPERNKELILDFADSCQIGWNGTKLSLGRVVKYLSHLKEIALILGDKPFDYVTATDIKRILRTISRDPKKSSEWTQYDYRVALRKFFAWLREEYGYPEDYPDREDHIQALNLMKLGLAKHPLEVSRIKPKKPDKLRDRDKIPSKEYMRYLRNAAVNPRDRAYLAVSEDLGPRIGGIGTRKIKHVEFDELGAKIYMEDKTLDGEPVRLTWSSSYLREWLEVHPFRDDPEAPLWVNLRELDRPVPLDYDGFRRIISRARRRHNRRAEALGLPKIPRDFDTYAFRYFAQIRDELNGVPRRVQELQRGWAPGSKQPSRYARLVAKDVDEYFKKKLGLKNGERDTPQVCPRCKEVNPNDVMFCRRCSMPLNDEASKYRQKVVELALRMLADPDLSKIFQQLVAEQASLFQRSDKKDEGGVIGI
jgi:hypothetical protein